MNDISREMMHPQPDAATTAAGGSPSAAPAPKPLDVAVIGAGPAGLTAALYAARAGLSVAAFERIGPGGQLAQTERIDNYPGFPQGQGGFELAWAMKEQADRFGVRQVGEEVTAVDLASEPKRLTTPFDVYEARSVVVATGSRPRTLGLANEGELAGRGVSYCATCDGNFFRGKTVVVVGGGNTAAADALYLSRICERVYLVHRRSELRATKVYHDKLAALDNVEFVWSAVPRELRAVDGKLAGVVVADVRTGVERELTADGLFVAIGTQPNTEFLAGQVPLDDAGYVRADGDTCATPVPGVFAAGDVRTKHLRQVSTAVGDGAVAAEQAAEFLAL